MTLNKKYWDSIEKEIITQEQVKKEMKEIMDSLIPSVMPNEKEKEYFISRAAKEGMRTFKEVIYKYHLNETDTTLFLTKFSSELRSILDLRIRKQALAKINFNSHEVYKVFKSLSSLLDVLPVKITRQRLEITALDPERISLLHFTVANDSFEFFKNGTIYINTSDFVKLLKCEATDNSVSEIVFGEHSVFISVNSKKYNTRIERKLDTLDFKYGDIPLNDLLKIQHTACFKVSKSTLQHVFKNFIGNDVVQIVILPDKVIFKEEVESHYINDIILNNKIVSIKFEHEPEQLDQKNAEVNQCKCFFSKEYLLLLDKLLLPLDKKEEIVFHMKEKHPLKVIMEFKKLETCQLLFFIVPRVDDDDWEKEQEEEEEEKEERKGEEI